MCTVLPSVYTVSMLMEDGICCRGRGRRILEIYDIMGYDGTLSVPTREFLVFADDYSVGKLSGFCSCVLSITMSAVV